MKEGSSASTITHARRIGDEWAMNTGRKNRYTAWRRRLEKGSSVISFEGECVEKRKEYWLA